MKTEKVGRIINGKPAHVYPVEAIEEAVRELEAGKTSMQDVMVKFGIARSNTIKRWIKTYGRAESFPGIRIRLPEPQKRQIVIEVESGKLSFINALKKYKISPNTLQNWQKKYSSEIVVPNSMRMEMKKNNVKNINETELIRNLKLKVAALETMIDIAEKEYNIEIRKKAGTKQ